MTHHLKTLPEFFQAVIDVRKPMEFRYNDRGFKAGDHCILEEFEGTVEVPACPDRYYSPQIVRVNDEEEYFDIPEDCSRSQCEAYVKEIALVCRKPTLGYRVLGRRAMRRFNG